MTLVLCDEEFFNWMHLVENAYQAEVQLAKQVARHIDEPILNEFQTREEHLMSLAWPSYRVQVETSLIAKVQPGPIEVSTSAKR